MKHLEQSCRDLQYQLHSMWCTRNSHCSRYRCEQHQHIIHTNRLSTDAIHLTKEHPYCIAHSGRCIFIQCYNKVLNDEEF